MSQSQLQAHSNPFAAPSDSLGPAVTWNPSRPLYESLRIAQIAFSVVAAYVLLMPFRLGSIEQYSRKFGGLAIVGIVVVWTGCILMRELRTYWSEDAAKERKVIRIQAVYSLFLFLLALVGTKPYSSVITFALAAGWHVSAIFRDSMLRQRLQFAVAQSGNPASTSLHPSLMPENTVRTTWNSSEESAHFTVKTPQERRMMLLTWIRQTFLTRRAFAIASVTIGLLLGGLLLASYFSVVEVAHFQGTGDGDSVRGSLYTKGGALYAKCVHSRLRQRANGSWQEKEVTRAVRVGDANLIQTGTPSVHYRGGSYLLSFFVGNRKLAHYDGKAQVFYVQASPQ